MVANLSDAACQAIGANGLLARVGCYYHDIGKTLRPGYFIENQHSHQNPHDLLPPDTSRDIIIAHAEDGAKLLEKHKMPSAIIDVASHHHATTLSKYFLFNTPQLADVVYVEWNRARRPQPPTK